MSRPPRSRPSNPEVHVLGIDVGGTVMKGASMMRDRSVPWRTRCPTGRELGPEAVVERIKSFAGELVARSTADTGAKPVAIGLAVPGIVDEVAGIARRSDNIGWAEVPLRSIIEEEVGLPVRLMHDVRAGGLAEHELGAARDARCFLFVPIGTGVAAALFMDGRAYTGANNAAGEIGHVVAEPDGPACHCGGRGCVETLACGPALVAGYRAATGKDVDASEVAKLATAGDPIAGAVWHRAVEALAVALALCVAIFDPALIVVGGGVAKAGRALLTPLTESVRKRLTVHSCPPIMISALGEDAGCLGAGLGAWHQMEGARAN